MIEKVLQFIQSVKISSKTDEICFGKIFTKTNEIYCGKCFYVSSYKYSYQIYTQLSFTTETSGTTLGKCLQRRRNTILLEVKSFIFTNKVNLCF